MCPGNQKPFPNSGVEKYDGRGIREEAAGGCRATWLMPGLFTSYIVQTWSFESGMDAYKEYVGKQDCPGKTRLRVRVCGHPNINHRRLAWLHERKLELVSGWEIRVLGLHIFFSSMSSHSLTFSFLDLLEDELRNQSCKRTWWDNNIYLMWLSLLHAASKENEQRGREGWLRVRAFLPFHPLTSFYLPVLSFFLYPFHWFLFLFFFSIWLVRSVKC